MDEELIKRVIEEVLGQLQAAGTGNAGYTDGRDKVLVVGDAACVPASMAETCEILPIEDYVQYGNIYRYQKILITKLTLTQMSDIAQGRDGSPESCAVIAGLLNGMEVCMLEEALPHRKYAGKGSSRLYAVIENNAKMIQTFGVKLLKKSQPIVEAPVRPAKYQAPPVVVPQGSGCPNSEKLITEAVARALAAEGNQRVCLAKNAIITPLAWDIFNQHGMTVVRQP
jgi:ethanolamine utilization protein